MHHDMKSGRRFNEGNDTFGELDLQIAFLSAEGGCCSWFREEKLDDRSFSSLLIF